MEGNIAQVSSFAACRADRPGDVQYNRRSCRRIHAAGRTTANPIKALRTE